MTSFFTKKGNSLLYSYILLRLYIYFTIKFVAIIVSETFNIWFIFFILLFTSIIILFIHHYLLIVERSFISYPFAL